MPRQEVKTCIQLDQLGHIGFQNSVACPICILEYVLKFVYQSLPDSVEVAVLDLSPRSRLNRVVFMGILCVMARVSDSLRLRVEMLRAVLV